MRRIISAIQKTHPQTEITIRADAGYYSPVIYQLAREKKANYCIAIAKNMTLMESIESTRSEVHYEYMLGREKTELVEADLLWVIRLKKVDFPTFGLPTIATICPILINYHKGSLAI